MQHVMLNNSPYNNEMVVFPKCPILLLLRTKCPILSLLRKAHICSKQGQTELFVEPQTLPKKARKGCPDDAPKTLVSNQHRSTLYLG